MKISVIVPSYNQGQYIELCIKSVLKQEYTNWELIIQDGNSQDTTASVCKKYTALDGRITFYSEKDKGFSDAVNKALSHVTGTLAIIQSSDDFFASPQVFKHAVEIFSANPRLNIISGAAIVLDENLKHLQTQEKAEKYIPVENVFTLKDHFSQGATFFAVNRAIKVNKLHSTVDMVADTDFWIRMSCFSPIHINSIYQTSEIWGCVLVQPRQRSADLSKFFFGRARMSVNHAKDNSIELNYLFKKDQANKLIATGIQHYKALNLDIKDFVKLYEELNESIYIDPAVSFKTTLKNKLKGLIKPNTEKSVFNSKEALYQDMDTLALYNAKWFD